MAEGFAAQRTGFPVHADHRTGAGSPGRAPRARHRSIVVAGGRSGGAVERSIVSRAGGNRYTPIARAARVAAMGAPAAAAPMDRGRGDRGGVPGPLDIPGARV